MTVGILVSIPREFVLTAAANTLAGAELYVYENLTTTPVTLYSDRACTTPAANPIVSVAGFFPRRYMASAQLLTLTMKNTAGSTIHSDDYVDPAVGGTQTTLTDALLASLAGLSLADKQVIVGTAADTVGAAPYSGKNRLLNGGMVVNQRGSGSGIADDAYCIDGWYILTQTGTIAWSQLTDPESGAPYGLRLTQSQASAQRIGVAQIIKTRDCRDLRSAVTTLAGRVRLSTSSDVRYAVLEWTGTADAVTSDVVADWTSSSYTAGGFFNSTTLAVLAVGEVTCSAATARALDALNATVGASMNNIIVFVWTEGTLAQNGTLDIWSMQFEAGAVDTGFEHVPHATEFMRCRKQLRYEAPGNGKMVSQGLAITTTQSLQLIAFSPPMDAAPTAITVSNGAHFDSRDGSNGVHTTSSLAFSSATPEAVVMLATVASGLTAGQVSQLFTTSASAALSISTEP